MALNLASRKFLLRHADSLIAACAGFYILTFFTRYSGVGISPDSVMYISTARNMNANHGFTYFGDKPFVAFPLFYPTFLGSILFITGVDPVVFGPLLNSFLFAVLILLTGVILERLAQPSKVYKWFVLLAMVLSPSLLQIYSMLWSETLFMIWMLVFIIACNRYLKTHSLKALFVIAAIAAFACITRYAGVTIIGTGGLLLLFHPFLKVKKKIAHILIFSITAISLLIINLLRNAAATHTVTGPRYKALNSLGQNMRLFGSVMCNWFTLPAAGHRFAFTIALVLVLIFAGAFIYCAFSKRVAYGSFENILTAFFVVYSLFMIVSATISRYQDIDNRLLSPLFIPFLIGCSYWFVRIVKGQPAKVGRILTVLGIGFALLFLYGQANKDWQRYSDEGEYGTPGYTDDDWNKSELIKTIKSHPNLFNPAYPVYNNATEAFYFFTRKNSEYLPKHTEPKQLKQFDKQPHGYVVMFDNLPDTSLLTVPQIRDRKKQLQVIYHFADGGIFEF